MSNWKERTALFNGLYQTPWEYDSAEKVWNDTYDADFDGEGYVGSCVCPHCQDVANHYQGAFYKGDVAFSCGACGHQSEATA